MEEGKFGRWAMSETEVCIGGLGRVLEKGQEASLKVTSLEL